MMLRQIFSSSSSTVATVSAPTLPAGPGIGSGDLLSVGVGMFIVVAVIVALGWLYSRSRFLGGSARDVINVVASRSVGPKERLMVVEVADQQLLVGMTASGVQTLHVLEKPVSVTDGGAKSGSFAGRLRTALQEVGK